jgi:chitodextrinase
MTKKLLFLVFFLGVSYVFGQDLHSDSNAASISNESNSTTGWTNDGSNVTSSSENPLNGSFALSLVATRANASGGKGMSYTFNAVIGETYDIRIWARRGALSSNPAFANWTGFSNFSVTTISSTQWTEYTWSLTATSSTPVITVFAAPYSGGQVGDQIFIDNVSIIQQGLDDSEPPSNISNLSASNITLTSVNLSWSPSSDNVGVVNYEVFQDGISIGNTGVATNFNVTGLSPDTSYDFTVVAEDAAGNSSAAGNIETVTTLSDIEAPGAVTDLSFSNTTTTGTQLSWGGATDNVAVINYEVFQDGVSIANTGTATTFSVTGLAPDTIYDFTIVAEDAAGNTSTAGNIVSVTTNSNVDTESPSTITDLTSSNITSTGVNLSWSAATDNIAVINYEVFQDGQSIANTGTATTINVTGLTPETSYDFTVIAEDAEGNISVASNVETVLTLAAQDTEAPSAITDLSSSNITSTSVDLTWSPSTDNVGVTNYEIFQNGVSIANTGTTTSFSVTGLLPNTGYDFTVFAEDVLGNTSLVSNTETVNTPGIPDTEAPTAIADLTATNTTSSSTDLSWSASSDNVGVTNYEVFRDGVSIGNTSATTFNVTGLSPDTSYDFTVFAEDSAGNISSTSNTEAVTTSVGTGIIDYTSENSNLSTVDWTANNLFANQNLGIGTTDTQGYRLAVAGNVIAEGVRVELQVNWPDFVFEPEYKLPDLDEVRSHIKAFGHLPNVPSAKKVEQEGIDLGTMDAMLLQKIEELTMYILEQQEQIETLKRDIKSLKGSN